MWLVPEPWLLHPMAVHFPIALLTVGMGVEAVAALRGRPPWASQAASWLLWLGTAAWAALGLGLLAEETAPHVPSAWKEVNEHKELAFWTVGIFTALSLLRGWLLRKNILPKWERLLLAGWLVGMALLIATAYHGGELVFTFGMGTKLTAQ